MDIVDVLLEAKRQNLSIILCEEAIRDKVINYAGRKIRKAIDRQKQSAANALYHHPATSMPMLVLHNLKKQGTI